MKVRRALKVLSITASLLGSSFPVYAQDNVEEKGWISRWTSWLTGGDSSDEEEVIAPSSSVRPIIRPLELELERVEAMTSDELNDYMGSVDVHQLICSGDIPDIQLSGLDGLIREVTSSCGIDIGDFSTQSSVLFCQEINEQFKDGACFEQALNHETNESYLDAFYNNPYIREQFIQEQKERLENEKRKMSELKSFQFSLSNDPQALAELKDMLFKSMKNESGYEYFKESFNLDEQTAQWIKSGRIPLSDLSDAVFQCSPMRVTHRSDANPYDESLTDVCGLDERGNDLFEEVKEDIRGINGQGSSLLFGEVAEDAINFHSEIDDTFKMMISDIYRGRATSTDDPVIAENASTEYALNARMIFSAIDAHPGGSNIPSLIENANSVIRNEGLSEARKIEMIRGKVLDQSVSSLLASYDENSNDHKIMKAIQNNFIQSSEDGVSKLSFQGENSIEVISYIRSAVGIEDHSLDNDILNIAQSIAATTTLGTQIYKSESQRVEGERFSPSGLTIENISSAADKQLPAKDRLLTKFRGYLARTGSGRKGSRDIGQLMNIIENNESGSQMTVGPRLEMQQDLLLVSNLLAQDCNSLINRDEEKKERFCPQVMSPRSGNVMLKGVLNDPASMEGDTRDINKNILTACRAIGIDAVVRAKIEESTSRATTAEERRRAYEVHMQSTCAAFNESRIISPELYEDPSSDSYCGIGNTIIEVADEISRYLVSDDRTSHNPLLSGITVGTPSYTGSDRIDFFEDKRSRSNEAFLGSNFDTNSTIKGSTNSVNLLDTYNGRSIDSPSSLATGNASTGIATPSGINSNIFSTNNVSTPVTNSSFVPTRETDGESDELISSEDLRREMEDSNGGIDPNIQRILDQIAAMEEREKSLIDEQNKLRDLINNPTESASVEEGEVDQSQSDLAAVTAELDALKKEMSSLVTDARNENQNGENENYRVSNFSRPSASPTPSSSQRAPASIGSNYNGNIAGGSGGLLPSSSSSGRGGSIANAGGSGYSAGGGILGNVSPDGLSAPAYTQNETFVLTQSIRDKAPIMPAGVSIEQAVLENRGAILVPYGNGQYMYVEPEMSENGDILTRDGRVVYKEVLKISDPEVIASRSEESGDRAPASVEEFDPSEKIYDWDDFSRQLDEAQN